MYIASPKFEIGDRVRLEDEARRYNEMIREYNFKPIEERIGMFGDIKPNKPPLGQIIEIGIRITAAGQINNYGLRHRGDDGPELIWFTEMELISEHVELEKVTPAMKREDLAHAN